jgi:hypothetical protein
MLRSKKWSWLKAWAMQIARRRGMAHTVGNQTERAYRRLSALEKRRELMDAWANYCEPKAANVIAMRGKPISA